MKECEGTASSGFESRRRSWFSIVAALKVASRADKRARNSALLCACKRLEITNSSAISKLAAPKSHRRARSLRISGCDFQDGSGAAAVGGEEHSGGVLIVESSKGLLSLRSGRAFSGTNPGAPVNA